MPTYQASSELYWWSALAAALIDVPLVFLLARRIRRESFRQLAGPLAVASAVFWLALWGWVMQNQFVWETCYQYVFPAWARWAMPPIMAAAGGAGATGMWWLAQRSPGNPILVFSLLGGLDSFPGHLWAAYGRGLFEVCPLLQQVSVVSGLTFGVFEFIFYWCVILTLAVVARRVSRISRSRIS